MYSSIYVRGHGMVLVDKTPVYAVTLLSNLFLIFSLILILCPINFYTDIMKAVNWVIITFLYSISYEYYKNKITAFLKENEETPKKWFLIPVEAFFLSLAIFLVVISILNLLQYAL